MDNVQIVRAQPVEADGTRRKVTYVFGIWDWAAGKIFLETVWESHLPKGKRRWIDINAYSRLTLGRGILNLDESKVNLPPDVIDEAEAKIRASIHFSKWADRNKP